MFQSLRGQSLNSYTTIIHRKALCSPCKCQLCNDYGTFSRLSVEGWRRCAQCYTIPVYYWEMDLRNLANKKYFSLSSLYTSVCASDGQNWQNTKSSQAKSLTKTQAETNGVVRRLGWYTSAYPKNQDKNSLNMRCFSFLLHGHRAMNPLCMPWFTCMISYKWARTRIDDRG